MKKYEVTVSLASEGALGQPAPVREAPDWKCRSCRFWNNQTDLFSPAREIGWGECDKVRRTPLFEDITEFKKDADGEHIVSLREEYAGALMATQDGSGYRADLFTNPDFGCVCFEAGDYVPESN